MSEQADFVCFRRLLEQRLAKLQRLSQAERQPR